MEYRDLLAKEKTAFCLLPFREFILFPLVSISLFLSFICKFYGNMTNSTSSRLDKNDAIKIPFDRLSKCFRDGRAH